MSAFSWSALVQAPVGTRLATVVQTRGSAYRRAGARMLLGPDGERVGTVSAGCLENDLAERCQLTRAAELVVYDQEDASEDLLWGLGLGCQGRVEVVLEPVTPELRQLAAQIPDEGSYALAVLTRGGQVGTVALDSLSSPYAAELRLALIRGRSHRVQWGDVEFFCNLVQPRLRLSIFGSGSDVEPLVEAARSLNWNVRVFDPRRALQARHRFPQIEQGKVAELVALLPQVNRHAVVIMTHHFDTDLEIFQSLAALPPPYVGVLGPTRRTDALLAKLDRQFPPGIVHGPVGLDLGAEAPEEVALSIVAEIQAFFHRGRAGFLKDRSGPIHLPEDHELERIELNPIEQSFQKSQLVDVFDLVESAIDGCVDR